MALVTARAITRFLLAVLIMACLTPLLVMFSRA
jgi:hypothetical protein